MKYGSIATGSIESLETAELILRDGGNAFDAAIAAVFTSMTSEFALTGAGGGGTMLGMKANESPIVYDFFVDCPKLSKKDVEFSTMNVDFGDTKQQFHIGKGSIAVPGNIAGLLDIHEQNGKLPLKVILEPAINIANKGVILSPYQAFINKLIEPILVLTPTGKELFTKNNTFLKEGELFNNPRFSDFLIQLGKDGKDFFYKNQIAKLIDTYFSKEGYISKESLANYSMQKRAPLSMNINNYSIFTNPAPAYSGSLMIFLLTILKNTNKLDASIIDLIKAMEITSLARNDVCNNPENEMEINNVLNDEIIQKYQTLFLNDNYTHNISKLSGFGSTTHISVIDKDYNVASVTTTNGEGSGYFIPEFGIMMNNMLGEQDLNPYGFHQWKNIRRLPTMICPTIILKDNKPEFAIGSGGSNRIRSAIIQVIINLLIRNMPLKEAISMPRLHLEGNELFFEPDILLPKNRNDIKHLLLNPFHEKSLFFGGVNCVSPTQAIGDKRRGGVGKII